MIRRIGMSIALLTWAAPGSAAEGGPIRGGEHDAFSRIVLLVEPTTEWSLESGSGRATLYFPGRNLDFSTDEVFDRLPKTRIREVDVRIEPRGTKVSVELGCDCRVSTAFVSARYLALDVSEREAGSADIPAPEVEVESPGDRLRRESAVVTSAEDVLIQQIERAANQGLIGLSTGRETEDEDGRVWLPTTLGSLADTMPPSPPARPGSIADAQMPLAGDSASPSPMTENLIDRDQITAMTVFDRDGHNVVKKLGRSIPAPECLPDERLAVAQWSEGGSFAEQSGELNRRMIREFDAVDTEAMVALVRLYIYFGMGAEAEMVMRSFGYQGVHRALLIDMARVVDGRPASPYGPLARNTACPGAHGLWLATSGAAPVFHSSDHFLTVHAAFASLPRHLRTLVGPALINGLIDVGKLPEARLIYETAVRPGHVLAAQMKLAEARLIAGEGSPRAAIEALNSLIEADPHNHLEVLTELVTLALDNQLPIPDRTLTDLNGALTVHRDTHQEPQLRLLLARTHAAREDLPAAMAEIRASKAKFPERPEFEMIAVSIMSQAEPARNSPATYAEIMLAESDLIPEQPEYDAARAQIATRLLALGLPQLAADIVAPAAARVDPARFLLAEANLRLGRTDLVRLVMSGMESPRAAALIARSEAIDGNFDAARGVLKGAGMSRAAEQYAWPAGDWQGTVNAAREDPARAAMAEFMTRNSDATLSRPSAVAPEALSPPQAFVEPLPRLDRPTLDAARRLLSTSDQLEDFVGTMLEPGMGVPP